MGFVILGIVLAGLTVFYIITTMQDVKIKKAEQAVEEGNLDVAMTIFMESLKKHPENPEALWHIGNINEEKENFLEAIGYYSQLISLDKESPLFTKFELHKRSGILYKLLHKDKEALDHFLQAYKILPNERDVLNNIAQIVSSQKQFYRSLPYFEKSYSFLKEDEIFMICYGLTLLMVDSINDALKILEEATKLIPESWVIKFLLSYTYMRIGAYRRGREFMEDVVNAENVSLSPEEMFFGLKTLFLSYTLDKSYEVARSLHKQMENILIDAENVTHLHKDEISMSFIFLRLKQEYYGLAFEHFNKNLEVGINLEGMDEETQNKVKENRSFLYELLSKMDKYKKEQERLDTVTNTKSHKKEDTEFHITKKEAVDAKDKLEILFESWKWKFLSAKSLWEFFKPKTKTKFDPIPMLDKYSTGNIKVIKDKFKQIKKDHESGNINTFKALGIKSADVCGSLYNIDFPTFQLVTSKLSKVMGYKVIDPTLKVDPISYSEGLGCDVLCDETFGDRQRILFCMRRWRDPVGLITIRNLKGALKIYHAKKLVIISISPLSTEAQGIVEADPNTDFHLCEDISSYLI